MSLLLPSTACAAAPPWGACGVNTDPNKIVVQYYASPRMFYTLRCGGPKYSHDPTTGYRHILWRHRTDFENLAAGTYQNWRDVADLAMRAITRDADHRRPATDGKICHSRLITLVNLRTNQVVRRQNIVMFTNQVGDIITTYPQTRRCDQMYSW